MLNFVLWVTIGGVLGALAAWRGAANTPAGLMMNVLAGVVGAYVAALLVTPLLAAGTLADGQVSWPAMLIAGAGAGLLLVVVNLNRRPATVQVRSDE